MTFWLSDDGTPIIKPCLQQVNCFHSYHLANVIVSSLEQSHEMFTIRYDTGCYFYVRSKDDVSQLNIPDGNNN